MSIYTPRVSFQSAPAIPPTEKRGPAKLPYKTAAECLAAMKAAAFETRKATEKISGTGAWKEVPADADETRQANRDSAERKRNGVLLKHLKESGPTTYDELERALLLKTSTLGGYMGILRKQGLVTIQNRQAAQTLHSITEKGLALLEGMENG